MEVAQALNLALLLLQQILPALQSRSDTIEIENLGAEHRAALAELAAYLDKQREAQDEPV